MNARLAGLARGRLAFALAALLFASSLFAQDNRHGVAQLRDVEGNVLVSRESGLFAGSEGLRLAAGTRVITTRASQAVVVYDDGCEVKLKENERFEVETGRACTALVAMPQSILATPAGATVAAGAGAAAAYGALLPVLGGAAGIAVLRDFRESRPVSPS